MASRIELPAHLWEETMGGLAARSQGVREAACIWAGTRASDTCRASEVLFLDDLPGAIGHARSHRTPRQALEALFSHLRLKGLQIIADIHTHPGSWVGLSSEDRKHPIEFRVGLVAIIIPHFAQMAVKLTEAGVHEYLGQQRWRQLPPAEIRQRFTIPGGDL